MYDASVEQNQMFVFYDLETTGEEPAFSQIIQFGAILADDDFNERERFTIRCRLLPHIVPEPEALLANRVGPGTLTDGKLPSHYEAVRQIRAKLAKWSPAIFFGYNSIKFDEEFLRQAFYQTLHPAFLTNTKGNARGDLMRVIHAASVYAPESLVVPKAGDGKPTYRLGEVARANGYKSSTLHEAMADVEATIYLARHVKQRAPKIWETMVGFTRKDAVVEFLTTVGAVAFTEFAYNKPYSRLVTYCGRSTQKDSDLAVFDLDFDPSDYLELPPDELVDALNGDKAVRMVAANRQPILMPATAAPSHVSAKQLPKTELQRRVKLIQQNQEFCRVAVEALSKRFEEKPPSPYVEKRIYDGFPSRDDEQLMGKFHQVDWSERGPVARRMNDTKIRELAERLLFYEKPELLPGPVRARYASWVTDRMLSDDPSVPWTTVPKAMREADDLLTKANREDADFLKDVKAFLKKLAARYSQ